MVLSWLKDDPEEILTRFGVFLGVLSVLYFGREAILDLSPVAKSVLLVLSSVSFLLASRTVENRDARTYLYIFSGISYLTFLGYYGSVMEPETEILFLLLALSAIAFTLIGRKIEEFRIEQGQAIKACAAILVIVLAVLGFEQSAPAVEYDLDLDEEVYLGEGGINVGSLNVRNSYMLPQTYDAPRYEACTDQELSLRLNTVDYSDTEGVVSGNSVKQIEYEIRRVLVDRDENNTPVRMEVVETDDCPEDRDGNRIYVYQVENEY